MMAIPVPRPRLPRTSEIGSNSRDTVRAHGIVMQVYSILVNFHFRFEVVGTLLVHILSRMNDHGRF